MMSIKIIHKRPLYLRDLDVALYDGLPVKPTKLKQICPSQPCHWHKEHYYMESAFLETNGNKPEGIFWSGIATMVINY
jgi:hypothetical protein